MDIAGYVITGMRKDAKAAAPPHILSCGHGTPAFLDYAITAPSAYVVARRAFLHEATRAQAHAYSGFDLLPCTQGVLDSLTFGIDRIQRLDAFEIYKPADHKPAAQRRDGDAVYRLCTTCEFMFEVLGRPKNPSAVTATGAAQECVPV